MKARGAILIALGLFLVVAMAAIALALVPNLLDAGKPSAGGRTFTGTRAQGWTVITLFGLVVAFGLTMIANGLYQAVTGRQHPALIGFTLIVFSALSLVLIVVGRLLA